jgi:hypothetical protein
MLIAFRPIASMGVEVMTQYFSFVGLLGIAVSLAGCPSSDIVVCDPVDCISEQHFSNNIVSSLQTSPGVAGYVVYVGGLPPAMLAMLFCLITLPVCQYYRVTWQISRALARC